MNLIIENIAPVAAQGCADSGMICLSEREREREREREKESGSYVV